MSLFNHRYVRCGLAVPAVAWILLVLAGCGSPMSAGENPPAPAVVSPDGSAGEAAPSILQTEKELFAAVEAGRTADVAAALDAHPAWIDSRAHHWGVPPLCIAAWKGHDAMVAMLLDRGAEVDACNPKWNWRALHEAADQGHARIVKQLIDHGADLELPNHDGRTPLMMALENGHRDAAGELIAAGAAVRGVDDEGWTLLHIVAADGTTDLAELLLARGLDVNARSRRGQTPLFWAADKAMVATLTAAGADSTLRDAHRRTPAHIAAIFGRNEALTALAKAPTDINAIDDDGATPLDLAEAENRDDTVRLLAAYGARHGRALEPGPAPITRAAANGSIHLNGEAVFPFAIWQQPRNLFDYDRSLGVDWLAYPPGGGHTDETSTTAYVEAAAARNMGVIMHYRPELASLAGVVGWAAESGGYRGRRHYEALRQVRPGRMICSNIGSEGVLTGEYDEFYGPFFDVIDCVIPHVWPEMFEGKPRNLRLVGDLVDRIRLLCKDRPGGEIAIMPDINPHEWRTPYGPQLNPAPTKEEFRFQVWLAIIHGADGICLFPISFNPFVFNQIPAGMAEYLPTLTGEVHRFEKVLAADESPLTVRVDAADEAAILDVATRRHDGCDYVFVLNGTAEQAEITLSVDGLETPVRLENALTDEAVAFDQASHNETLAGLDLRIWRLRPSAR